MKNTLTKFSLLLLLSVFAVSSCKKDDDSGISPTTETDDNDSGNDVDGNDDNSSAPTTVSEIENLISHVSFDTDVSYADEAGRIPAGKAKGTVLFTKDRKEDNAIELDGNSYLQWNHNDYLYSNKFTISIWAKHSGNHPEFLEYLFHKEGQYSASFYTETFSDSEGTPFSIPIMQFKIGNQSPGFNGSITVATNIKADEWQHFAFVSDGTTLKMYVDGLEVKSQVNMSGNISTNSNKLYLGANVVTLPAMNPIISGGYNGALDEFRFYNRALTANEILLLAE